MSTQRGRLAVIFLTVFIDLIGFGIIMPILPYYAQEFGAKGLGFGALVFAFTSTVQAFAVILATVLVGLALGSALFAVFDARWPRVRVLMAAQAAPNVLLDTSSSNRWTSLHPGLTLREVFARALDCVGADRLLFGTDSSFFPRGWQNAIYEEQRAIVADLGVDATAQAAIFGGNFARVFTSRQP